MYPATSIQGFPLAAGVRAGVHLTPEGLKLHGPATLTMDLQGAVDPKQLVGVAYKGDAQEKQLYPAFIAGQRVTFAIVHFSGYDLGNATLNELINMPVPLGGAGDKAQQQLVIAYNDLLRTGRNPEVAYINSLHDWYVGSVRNLLQRGGAATSVLLAGGGGVFVDAPIEYDAWLSGIEFAARTAVVRQSTIADETESKTLVAAMVRNEIRLRNAQCIATASSFSGDLTDITASNNPLIHAAISMVAQADSHRWGVDIAANQLDLETVLNGLCVKVVIQSATFPSDFKPGQSGTLRVKTGLAIAGGSVRHDVPIKVKLSRGGAATGAPSSGATDAQGVFSSSVGWPVGVSELKVDMLAAVSTNNSFVRKIARFDVVRTTFTSLVGTYDGTRTDTTPGHNLPPFACHLVISRVGEDLFIEYNDEAISAPLTVTGSSFVVLRSINGKNSPLTGTLSGNTLTGDFVSVAGRPENGQEHFVVTRVP
jgi:hypothetical protein